MNKLHIRLSAAFMILVIFPIFATGLVVVFKSQAIQIRQSLKSQEQMVQRVESEFTGYIRNYERALLQLISVRGLLDLEPEGRNQVIEEMIAFGNNFEELILLDGKGHATAHVHRFRPFFNNPSLAYVAPPAFHQIQKTGQNYFGSVHFDDETGEPLIQIGVPYYEMRSNTLRGVLMAELRLKPIWDLLATIPVSPGQQVYILDADHLVIAHPDPSVVLRGTSYTPREGLVTEGLNHIPSIVAQNEIRLGNRQFTVVAERSKKEVLQVADQFFQLLLFLGLLALLMSTILIVLLFKQFVRPVQHLVEVAHAIEGGDTSCRAQIAGKDEVGELALSFNQMTDKLQSSMRRLEREIQEREQLEMRFQQLAEHSTDWIWEIDEDMIFTYSSPGVEKILGYQPEELPGMSIFDLIPSQEKTGSIQRIEQRKNNQQPFSNFQTTQQHRKGHLVTIESSGTPVLDTDGKFKGFRGISRDISDRIRMEDELRQAHKMESIGTLAGGIAHDFNNLLSIIIGNTELALEDVPAQNSAQESIREIKTASLRAKEVVQQLLSYSRKDREELKPMDIAPVIKTSLKLVRSSIPSSIEIKDTIPERMQTVLADATQMSQVMINLCTNAVHAMPEEKGVIEISMDMLDLDSAIALRHGSLSTGQYLKITVKDSGTGIDPKNMDKVFDPYFTTKDIGKGTGMGLAMVHGIVKSHGGYIDMDSQLGKGTAVRVYLPVSNAPSADEGLPAKAVATGFESCRILFVDDEKMIADMARTSLERQGYIVSAETSPEDALESFARNPSQYDIVISDMTMPQISGVELAQKLKDIREDIPIIICTGHSSLIDEKKSKEFGISALVRKPISMKALSEILLQILNTDGRRVNA